MSEHRAPATRLAIGIALMATASLAIPAVDGIAKLLGATHSPFFVAWARYVAAALIVVPLTGIGFIVLSGLLVWKVERVKGIEPSS